ncbi:MAG: hypothetical protein QXT00_02410 [Ignisphaera sp.]
MQAKVVLGSMLTNAQRLVQVESLLMERIETQLRCAPVLVARSAAPDGSTAYSVYRLDRWHLGAPHTRFHLVVQLVVQRFTSGDRVVAQLFRAEYISDDVGTASFTLPSSLPIKQDAISLNLRFKLIAECKNIESGPAAETFIEAVRRTMHTTRAASRVVRQFDFRSVGERVKNWLNTHALDVLPNEVTSFYYTVYSNGMQLADVRSRILSPQAATVTSPLATEFWGASGLEDITLRYIFVLGRQRLRALSVLEVVVGLDITVPITGSEAVEEIYESAEISITAEIDLTRAAVNDEERRVFRAQRWVRGRAHYDDALVSAVLGVLREWLGVRREAAGGERAKLTPTQFNKVARPHHCARAIALVLANAYALLWERLLQAAGVAPAVCVSSADTPAAHGTPAFQYYIHTDCYTMGALNKNVVKISLPSVSIQFFYDTKTGAARKPKVYLGAVEFSVYKFSLRGIASATKEELVKKRVDIGEVEGSDIESAARAVMHAVFGALVENAQALKHELNYITARFGMPQQGE